MKNYSYSTEVKEEGMISTPEGYVYCFKSDGYLGVMSATKIYIPAAFDAIEVVPTKDRHWPFFAVVKMNDKYGIVSYRNELLLECIYDDIKRYKNSSNSLGDRYLSYSSLIPKHLSLRLTQAPVPTTIGGGGLSIASFANVGIKDENKEGKEEISRIKFMIPMALPEKE